jgi:hypothetical protein
MDNLAGLLPNVTPVVSRFFSEMSKKRQRSAVVNLENNGAFGVIRQPIKRLCIASIITRTTQSKANVSIKQKMR